MAAIEVRGLRFRYFGADYDALSDVNLDVEEGETVLLVGPSGCGKSTLIRALNGLIPHRYAGSYSGSVRVAGFDVTSTPPQVLARRVGTVMQEVGKQLVAQIVEDDVAFGPSCLCLPREEVELRVERSLAAVGALHLRGREVSGLSGGEKQRVVFAGILAMDPDIILLDEPLANLDSEGVKLVLQQLEELKRRGKTLVVAEHRTEEIIEGLRVDRIVVMERGSVVKLLDSPEGLEEFKDRVRVPTRLLFKGELPRPPPQAEPAVRPDGEKLVVFEDVYYSYDGREYAVKGVSFEVRDGERVALLGNNGAGKSTIAKLMLGLLKPTRGRVLVGGVDTRSVEPYELAGKVGLVVQDPYSMLFARTVREELAFGPLNLGVPRVEVEERVARAAEVCGVAHLLNRSPFASSYGEKKRICVGAVLTMHPRVLVLDEPTAGQDYANYVRFLDFATSLKGMAIVLITHDTDVAIEYTDRTIVVSRGRVVADGPTAEVLAKREVLEAGSLRVTQLVRLGIELSGGRRVYRRRELEQLLRKQ